MCGIAGWIGHQGDLRLLDAMCDVLAHRGPDGHGSVIVPLSGDTHAALGHRRLSIIDLAGGDQPMWSHDRRFVIVFNGEIYNYRELRTQLVSLGAKFNTDSDTEVILEAWRHWGEGALDHFRGMFAFAIHDEETRTVSFARDPFGKKPLYYWLNPARGALVFGSEVSAVLLHPAVSAEIDVRSLYDYLTIRYVPGPHTLFSGVRKLVPGGVMTWRGGEVTERRYWIPPEARPDRLPPPADPVGAFLEVFDESVQLRLRADVPVGAFLSGGLDSTTVVATLAHFGVQPIRTFSVGFEGDPASELPLAAETARRFGTVHTPIELRSDELTSSLPMLTRHRGAPVAESADLPIYLMSVAAARDVKVILSGEGSDELFGGYPKHIVERNLGWMAPSGALSLIGRGVGALASIIPGGARRATVAARAMRERQFEGRMVRWFGAVTPGERDRMWRGETPGVRSSATPLLATPGASPLRQVLNFDQTSWLPDNLLERMDRMTMAASIEGRAPYMDVRLAEFAATLPDSWKVRGTATKRIVREALGPRIPDDVLHRPKNGFRMPVADWFRGPLSDPFRDLLLSGDSISGRYLDQSEVGRLLAEHTSGRHDHQKTLWSLYSLEIFLREFF